MRLLSNAHIPVCLSYLNAEPEINQFFIGDIETYGMDGQQVSVYTSKDWQEGTQLPYCILNYRGDFQVYSHNLSYPAAEVADFLKSFHPRNISGKAEIIAPLLLYFPEKRAIPSHLARLNQVDISPAPGMIRRLGKKDLESIYQLYLQIEEFNYTYQQESKEKILEELSLKLEGSGRIYGIFEQGQLVSVAQTTAETSKSAMIVGVATIPQCRNKGYAKSIMAGLCSDCLKIGMKFLCLFYENPSAGKLYYDIGFRDVGNYILLRNKEEA